ncbi:DUF397 domain-containing protein [Streptomyces sp. NPDC049881]|uniref:DUF397 domain-containing protein n=1 Tax=Streptomyces sp. NPDC049881 TaxID=3155778 RepID=UPI003449B551
MNPVRGQSALAWVRSSYSTSSGGQCVEYSPSVIHHGLIPVRDSKNLHGPTLTVPTGAWHSFLAAVRDGELAD